MGVDVPAELQPMVRQKYAAFVTDGGGRLSQDMLAVLQASNDPLALITGGKMSGATGVSEDVVSQVSALGTQAVQRMMEVQSSVEAIVAKVDGLDLNGDGIVTEVERRIQKMMEQVQPQYAGHGEADDDSSKAKDYGQLLADAIQIAEVAPVPPPEPVEPPPATKVSTPYGLVELTEAELGQVRSDALERLRDDLAKGVQPFAEGGRISDFVAEKARVAGTLDEYLERYSDG